MKRAFCFLTTSAIFFACGEQKNSPAESSALFKSASVSEPAPDSATMMKNWMAYMKPGKEHEMMTSWEGKWNSEITMWMAPGAPPSKTAGTAVNTMLMGGRYQQSTHTGSWDGMPFEGSSTLAFDNAKKIFLYTWIDNMGTGIMRGEGAWDEKTRSISIKGRMVDPGTLKEVDFREVYRIIDDNTQVMEMYAPTPDGKEFMTMEIRYTRSK